MFFKFRYHALLAAVIIFFSVGSGWSFYLNDNFSSPSSWITNLRYNMALGVWSNTYVLGGNDQGPQLFQYWMTGNKFTMNGGFAGAPVGYSSSFYGIYALFTNTSFNASKENPFGYEITRTGLWLSDGWDSWQSGVFDIGMVQAKAGVTNGASSDGMQGTKFDYSAMITELDWSNKSPKSWLNWRQASFTNSKILLTAVTNGSGGANDLSAIMEWLHGSGTNTNVMTYRFVNDGEYVYFYVNPNPLGLNANYSNAFYLISKVAVVFSTNLQIFFGLGAINYNGYVVCTNYGAKPFNLFLSNLTIRSVCSNVVSEISPAQMNAGANVTLYMAVHPVFSTNMEAGVEELLVDLPDNYTNLTNWLAYTNAMSVSWVGTNGSVFRTFTNQLGDANPASSGIVKISLKNGNKTLKVRFFSTNVIASSDVFHPLKWGGNADSNSILLVISNYQSSATANSTGKTFSVSVNNEKYPDTTWTNNATTGTMLSRAGNAMDMSKITNSLNNYDTLTYQTFNGPYAYSSVTPTKVYEGVATVYQYEISADNPDNNANITKATVFIPSNFDVDTDVLYSDKMGVSNGTYLYLTNIGGSNAIVADYGLKGIYLPASGGWDTLYIRCTNTTNVPNGSSGVNVNWPAVVTASITGTSTNTTTNAFYPTQSLLVRKKPPQGAIALTPYQLSNTAPSNRISVTIRNVATESPNQIGLVRIILPLAFTNADNIVSASNGTISTLATASNFLIMINYTNAGIVIPANGGYDVVQMTLQDTILPLSDITNMAFAADGDNMNGDTWIPLSQDSGGHWDVTFFTPPSSAYGHIDTPGPETSGLVHNIYTDMDLITNLGIIIENKGEEGNEISMARLSFPSGITNVAYVGDTKIAVSTLSNEYTNIGPGVTNTNIVLYLNYTNTLKPKTGVYPAEQDYVIARIADAIDAPASVHIDVDVRNVKTNFNRASEAPDNMNLTYIYPQVNANGYVSVPGGFIDWSYPTNLVEYVISNMGRAKNQIWQAQIVIPSDISTNIPVTMITSTLCTNNSYITYNGGVITVNYGTNSGTAFAGGLTDRITFEMIDMVTNTLLFRLTNYVTNSRTNVLLTESGSGLQNLSFQTPPVMGRYKVEPGVQFVQSSGASETDSIVVTVTNLGLGNNNIKQVQITSPFASGKIAEVYDSLMDTNRTLAPSLIGLSGNLITLNYNNLSTNLPAGSVDQVTISVVNDITNEQGLSWSVQAKNDLSGPPFTNLGIVPGYTNQTFLSEHAFVSLTPNVEVTGSGSNAFKYTLKNGTLGQPVGHSIYGLKIVVPSPYTNVTGVTIEQPGTVQVSNIDASTMWILVSYTSGLLPGEADNIRFTLFDNWVVGTNYVNLSSEADYNDGGSWRNTTVETNLSTGVSFSFPPASGTGYVTSGEWVPEDYTGFTYQFYLKNTGSAGNNIKLIKITPPSGITNVTSVTCLTKQVGGTFDGTNVWVNYESAGKMLSSSETDTIQLNGYDNVASGNVYSVWGFKVANTTTNVESYRVDITVPGNKDLSNIIYHPNAVSAAYLEAANPIDGTDSNKNKVWTTGTSNTFYYYIYNQSDSGNSITGARLYLPGTLAIFDTNSITVSDTKGGTIALSNNRSEIYVVYPSPVVPGDVDKIQVDVNDILLYGETNLGWTSEVTYDTTTNQFKTNIVYTGKSQLSYFLMPTPQAQAGIANPVPREIYIRTTNVTIAYRISNTGSGSDDLFSALINIPSPFRASFGAGSVSNSIATNVAYDGGTGNLLLSYSNNFKPGSNDMIYLNLQPSGLSVTNYTFSCRVSNSTYDAGAADIAVGSKTLDIVNVPTYYVTPNSLSTAIATNYLNVFLLNNSGGQAKLQKVVLNISAPFTDLLETNSVTISVLSNIMGMITSLTLDYQSAGVPISVGGNDTLKFLLADSLQVGDMTAAVTAKGYNGFQWVDMDQDVGGQTNVDFTMPPVSATALINYNELLTTATGTNMAVTVINKGSGNNKISELKIHVPGGLTNLTYLSNQNYQDAVVTITNDTIYVVYQNTNLVPSGLTDVVWFAFSNAMQTGTNLAFTLEGVNLTNGPIDSRFASLSGEGGSGSLNLRVDFPSLSVQGYINGRSQLSTINTNDTVQYTILNGSLNTYLTNACIYFDTNLFAVSGLSNTWPGAALSVAGNCISIDYSAGLQFSQRDNISISLVYHITNVTNTMLTSQVVLYGVTNGTFDTVNAGYTQTLDVAIVPWGNAVGQIYPTNYNVNAKLYYPGTSTIATNADGALASTVTGTNGGYTFSMIPYGTYTLSLSASMFREYRMDVTLASNTVNVISTITLENALLSSGSPSNQTVVCYDDNRTKMDFPVSSLTKDFSFNIYLFDLTVPQKSDLNANTNVSAPSSTTGLKGFWFDLKNQGDSSVEGEVLQLDATLYLSYDPTDIASRGWSEDNLAIYYWDRVASKWIKVGGTVDKINRYVTARVSYVHDIYGVFGGKTADGVIKNVVVRPKIFTPTKGSDGYFSSVRITFELDSLQAPDGYDVKIYDMRGSLVKSFSRKGSYSQGEVAWDSKDDEGYPVKGGVYVYRVLAGGKAYSGTIVIVR